MRPDDWMAGRRLAQLGLRDEGVAVLGVTRKGGHYVGAPGGGTLVQPGDLLVVYGDEQRLQSLDDRPSGPDGDAQHAAAVASQRQHEAAEAAAEPAG